MNRLKTLLAPMIILLAAGCGSDSSQVNGGEVTPGVTDTEIILGSHSDLSGPVSYWGVGSINAVRMHFDAVNAAGGIHGRKIRFIVEDTQYQVPRAIQAANKLINRDQIFAMVLALGTPMNNAVMTQQIKAGVPNLFPLTGGRQMVEPYQDLIFMQRGIYYDEIRAGVRYFLEVVGKEAPCVVYQDTDYGQEVLQGARDQLQLMGRELAGYSTHKPTESEFTPTILRLRGAGCDLVFLATAHRDTILLLEAARKMQFDATFVGCNATYGQVIADQESGSGEGYYAFSHIAKIYREDGLSEELLSWWDSYEEQFGEEPDLPAMEGYRGADLLVLALERAGPNLTRESFKQAMESIVDYTGPFGYKVSFGEGNRKGVNESALSMIDNGRWKTLATSIRY